MSLNFEIFDWIFTIFIHKFRFSFHKIAIKLKWSFMYDSSCRWIILGDKFRSQVFRFFQRFVIGYFDLTTRSFNFNKREEPMKFSWNNIEVHTKSVLDHQLMDDVHLLTARHFRYELRPGGKFSAAIWCAGGVLRITRSSIYMSGCGLIWVQIMLYL